MPQRADSPRPLPPRPLAALAAGVVLGLLTALLPGATAYADPGAPNGKGRVASADAPGQANREARALKVLERVSAVLDGTRRGEETMARRDLRLVLEDLPPVQRATARAALSRPAPNPCDWDDVIVVHCSDDPVDFTAEQVLQAFRAAHDHFVSHGYKRPKGDRRRGGGRNKVDVYITSMGPGSYGYCDSDERTRAYNRWAYCAINSDFSWAAHVRPPLDNVKVTAAHEYFHAVQFNYDYLEDRWFMEATAAWMEDEVPSTDAINDNVQFLARSPLRRPARPMAKYGDGFHYGAWIFFRYLSERYGAGIVRSMWQRADATRGARLDRFSLQAIDGALRARRTGLRKAFARFSDANRRPRMAYDEGAMYPRKRLHGSRPLRGVGASRRFVTPGLGQLTSSTYRFVSRRNSGRKALRVTIAMPPRAWGSTATVSTYLRNGKVRTRYVRLNLRGDRVLRVPFASRRVASVEVTLANASRRMVRCYTDPNGTWPCYGFPRDRAQRGSVRGVVVRG